MSVLDGKVALVTGASRGIGRAIAEELSKQGAKVVGTATTEEGARKIGGRVLDVRNPEQCDALVEAVQKELGGIAILVNNAGITRDNLALRMKDAEWDAVMEANLRAVFQLSRAVMRGMMKARWGRIINVTSVVGAAGNAGQANYAAAKAGMHGFTKSLALEVAKKGVTVNTISPGYIGTKMVTAIPKEILDSKILPQIPVGRLGKPEEIAGLIIYLCSEEAAFVNGANIAINGGQHMA